MVSAQAVHAAKKRREKNDVKRRKPDDLERRNRLLSDPVKFLEWYLADRFFDPFADYQREVIGLIIEVMKFGGDQAIAAPRGDGKTELTKGLTIYGILAGLIRFPVIIGATGAAAATIYDDIRSQFENNERIVADFPEVCDCVVALQGVPQNCAKQTFEGESTKIRWSTKDCVFPTVPDSEYSGVCMTYAGMDSAIRGINIRGARPDFVLVDDPETRESAFSDHQIATRDIILNRDVAGLAGRGRQLSRVVLCTIQNSRCLSAKLTDPAVSPSWDGRRYSQVIKWPTAEHLWQAYIEKRQDAKREGDKFAEAATAFYIANREEMDAGVELLNVHRFNKKLTKAGTQIELSAIQAVFNSIADIGMGYVKTEVQNDPDEEETDQTLGLTAGMVASRVSGLQQHQLPSVEPIQITCGIDLGKFWSHWVKIAWFGNATGVVIDYGIMETPGLQANSPERAIELALLKSLLEWRTDILAVNPPAFCLVDSGDYSEAVYEFIRQSSNPFAASKGSSRFYMGNASDTRRHFSECYAQKLDAERLWLYSVNTEYWKQWVHERFVTPTFSDQHQFNDGSLSLFASPDAKKHLTFSHHIVAEERRELFVEGKGLVRKWVQVSKNNHWLDATALACCAAGIVGVRLIPRVTASEIRAAGVPRPRRAVPAQTGRFKTRPGGWVGGIRKNG